MKTYYTREYLEAEYNSLIRKIRSGNTIEELDRNLGAIMGHALDALDLTKEIGVPLDLNTLSSEEINKAIITMYMFYNNEGKSSVECRETASKKIGSYLFFAVCNFCNKSNWTAEPMAKGSSTYIRLTSALGEEKLIDVFSPMEKLIKNDLKYNRVLKSVQFPDSTDVLERIYSQIGAL